MHSAGLAGGHSAATGVGSGYRGLFERQRSRDPAKKLPALISAVDVSEDQVGRIALSMDACDTALRRVMIGGRRVRLEWFRGWDAHMIRLSRPLLRSAEHTDDGSWETDSGRVRELT